jgi:hypothetical protein
MPSLLRCSRDMGLWLCEAGEVRGQVGTVYREVLHQEDDDTGRYTVVWTASGVCPDVLKTGDWCGCKRSCRVGGDAAQIGTYTLRRKAQRATVALRALLAKEKREGAL